MKRKHGTAFGIFSVAAAMLLASISSSNPLRAKQDDEAAIRTSDATALRVPADIREEAIERIDMDFAASAGPLLRTVFNSEEPIDARKTALAELNALLGQLNVSTPAASSLKSRLKRRVELLDAAIAAAEVEDISAGGTETPVAAVAAETTAWLSTIGNGQLWTDFLHLSELSGGNTDPALLQQVSINLTPTESTDAAQRAFMERPQLQSLKATVEAAAAAGSHPDDTTAAREELKRQVDQLVVSVLAYETRHLAHDADRARSAYRSIRSRFPQAAQILRPVMVGNYFNHNLHITVSESLLSRMVADYRTESGRIADCIMGAWVTGSQVTSVNVTADIVPSEQFAAFQIRAAGNTQSNTVATKDPATVRTVGNHFFNSAKPVYFTGREVNSGPATIDVNVNSRTVSVNTKYDGIPIVGGIIRKIARNEVAKGQGQAEAMTRDRLREEALPRFEDEVGNQLAELNDTLNKTLASLDKKGVGPESISARSSHYQIAVSSRTMGVSRLGGSSQPPMPVSPTGLAVQMHETTVNNTLDALGFNGRAIPEEQVGDELEAALSELLQRDINLNPDEDEDETPATETPADTEPPTTFVFSQTDPIRVHFGDNEMVLVLRTGVIQEGKEDIPEQVITIPISVSLQEGKLILDPGNIGVSSKEETSRVRQIPRATQIRRILSRQVVRRELDTTFDLQARGDRSLMLTLSFIHLADGWMTAELQ